MKDKRIKALIPLVFVLLGLCSFFVLGKYLSDVHSYEKIIMTIDDKKTTVLGLTAASATISNAITLIPGDIGTPLANQFADLSKYLIIILVVLYLEKYLLTVIGFVVAKIIFPVSLFGFAANCYYKNSVFKELLIKITVFSALLLLLIPSSVGVTRMIDNTYEESMKMKVEEIVEVELENNEPITEDNTHNTESNDKWYSQIGSFFMSAVNGIKETTGNAIDAISNTSSNIINKAKNLLSNFIELAAIMLVTSCVIPLLTLAIFLFITKTFLGTRYSLPSKIDLDSLRENMSLVKKP